MTRSRSKLPPIAYWGAARDAFKVVMDFIKLAEKKNLALNGHECGHQYKVTISSCVHYGLPGLDPESHSDDNCWEGQVTTIVRAGDRQMALLRAAMTPFEEWNSKSKTPPTGKLWFTGTPHIHDWHKSGSGLALTCKECGVIR